MSDYAPITVLSVISSSIICDAIDERKIIRGYKHWELAYKVVQKSKEADSYLSYKFLLKLIRIKEQGIWTIGLTEGL